MRVVPEPGQVDDVGVGDELGVAVGGVSAGDGVEAAVDEAGGDELVWLLACFRLDLISQGRSRRG